MDATVHDIVAENEDRTDELFADYDPHLGTGSPIEREEVPLKPDLTVRVPPRMTEEPAVQAARNHGSVAEWAAERQDMTIDAALQQFSAARCRYDFEFWCSVAAHIELDAESRNERGEDIAPLILNRAQRIYWQELHRQWAAGEPVRIILLKARQWGGSTMTQCFFAWVQRYYRDAWNSFICNLTLDQARELRNMYELLVDRYPESDQGLGDSFTLLPYQGSTNIKQIEETGSIVGITTIENPDSPRSYDIHLAHLSEVGLWPSTPKVNAEDFAQAITGAVSNVGGTCIIEESTARGVGTYFHNHWQDAASDRSNYERLFIAWHDIPKYAQEVEAPADFVRQHLRPELDGDEDEIPERTEIARRLWRLGATLEGIRWYFDELAEFKGDLRRMQSEYPSTPREAFQSTGRRFFSLDLSARLRNQTTEPKETGTIVGDAVTGEEAFDDLRVKELPPDDAGLKVWRRPGDKVWWDGEVLNPEDKIIKRRFCAFADFGGKTAEADWSVITIGDRIKMIAGGPAEVVARLRVHMRPDLFAWKSAQLAYWYNQALLAYEVNRHKKQRGDDVRGYEPEWSLAIIENIMDDYDNLYLRTVQDRVDEPVRYEVGFHMNKSTKPLIYNTLEAGVSETPGGQVYYDPDRQFVDEMDTFEKKEDGSIGAVEGNHDDVLDSSAGTSWLALKYMDPPVRVDREQKRRSREPGAASFA